MKLTFKGIIFTVFDRSNYVSALFLEIAQIFSSDSTYKPVLNLEREEMTLRNTVHKEKYYMQSKL